MPLRVSSDAKEEAKSEAMAVFPRIEDARDVGSDPRPPDVGNGRSVADGVATDVISPSAFAMLVSSAAIDDATSEGMAAFPRIDDAREVAPVPTEPDDAGSGRPVASDVMAPPTLVRSAATDDATSDGIAVFPRIEEAKEVTSTPTPTDDVGGRTVSDAVVSDVMTAPMLVS